MKYFILFSLVSMTGIFAELPTLAFKQDSGLFGGTTFSLWQGKKKLVSCTARKSKKGCVEDGNAFHKDSNKTLARTKDILCIYKWKINERLDSVILSSSYSYTSKADWCFDLNTNSYIEK
ncbi:hypothetical protein DSO57_1018725 [Entomophthora muscae]|uniref:Uncharacterized protein n=1 Tax=Entomophthora muscae TaxID=34485 RepID=A0ACC2RIW4_9FUNG|nr:hypothetical protein DSO57_1018725 [Entomophthora muscae]